MTTVSVQKHKCVVASQESSPVISLGWEEPVWGCLTLLPVCLGKEGGGSYRHMLPHLGLTLDMHSVLAAMPLSSLTVRNTAGQTSRATPC